MDSSSWDDYKCPFVNFVWKELDADKAILGKLQIIGTPDEVSDIEIVFGNCDSLQEIFVEPGAFSGLASSKVRLHLIFSRTNSGRGKTELPANCDGLFAGSTSVYDIDFREVSTSRATSMKGMFAGCSNISELDLRSFDTKNVAKENMREMFQGCSNLKKLDVSSFAKEQKDDKNLPLMFYKFQEIGSKSAKELEILERFKIQKLCKIIKDDIDAKKPNMLEKNFKFEPSSLQQKVIEPAKDKDVTLKMPLNQKGNPASQINKESSDIRHGRNEQSIVNKKYSIAKTKMEKEPTLKNEIRTDSKILKTVPQTNNPGNRDKAQLATVDVKQIKQEKHWYTPMLKFFGWAKRKVLSWFK